MNETPGPKPMDARYTHSVVVLLFGPPGSGKGTQASLITEWLGVPSLSTGDMLRATAAENSQVGRMVKAVLATGHLVRDETVNRIVAGRLKEDDCRNGFMLDGYPRTVPQAQFLDWLLERLGLPCPTVLHLEVPFSVLVERIAARRYCPQCKTVYNLVQRPPLRPGVCDFHDVALATRPDDNEEVVTARLQTYQRLTVPVIDYYTRREADVVHIDGNREPGAISQEIEGVLESRFVRVGGSGRC